MKYVLTMYEVQSIKSARLNPRNIKHLIHTEDLCLLGKHMNTKENCEKVKILLLLTSSMTAPNLVVETNLSKKMKHSQVQRCETV